MATYFVIMKKGGSESSDKAVGSVPTEGTKILAAIEECSVVEVEATTQAKADEAARVAYPGRAVVAPKAATTASFA